MPNYRVHDTIGLVTAPIITGGTLLVIPQHTVESLVVGIAYLFATFFLSPDLDLKSKIYYRWGILRFIWLPYVHIVKHRSVYSHSGVFSATIRLLYLALWLIIPIVLLNAQVWVTFILLYVWIGVVLADIVHCIADFMPKFR